MKKPKKATAPSRYQIANGFRSGFERTINSFLLTLDRPFGYEEDKIKYIQPEKARVYTPDFHILKRDGSKMYLETKGRLTIEDRQKHVWIRECNPELDIRFVFMNPNAKIRKGSKTTYADWCDKNDFLYSPLKKEIPPEWLEE